MGATASSWVLLAVAGGEARLRCWRACSGARHVRWSGVAHMGRAGGSWARQGGRGGALVSRRAARRRSAAARVGERRGGEAACGRAVPQQAQARLRRARPGAGGRGVGAVGVEVQCRAWAARDVDRRARDQLQQVLEAPGASAAKRDAGAAVPGRRWRGPDGRFVGVTGRRGGTKWCVFCAACERIARRRAERRAQRTRVAGVLLLMGRPPRPLSYVFPDPEKRP